MKMKSLKAQFIGAIAMVLVAAVAMGSSTYAWFAMNNKVTVTGMEVKTKVSDNLLIAESTTATMTKEADSKFKTNYLVHQEGILEPVSSVDGVTFFYTDAKNVDASGDAFNDVYLDYESTGLSTTGVATGYKNKFSENYGVTNASSGNNGAVGYVDYAFQLKAVNSSAATKYVNLTGADLLYNGAATSEKAYRAAVFVYDMGEDGSTNATAIAAGALMSILRIDGATYFGTTADPGEAYAVKTASTLNTVSDKIDDAVVIGTIAQGKTNFYKVVVRLWLEGEDSTCNNSTFATLNEEWALNLAIEMQDDSTTAINELSKNNDANVANLGSATVSMAAADVVVVDGVTYGKISVQLNSTNIYTKDATLASTSKVYTFANGHLTDVTNQCNLPS